METPTLNDRRQTTLGGSYLEETLYFFVGDTATPDNFTGCTVVGGIYRNSKLVQALDAYVTVVNNPASVSINVPAAQMVALGVGVFTVMLWLNTVSGSKQPLVGYALEQSAP